MPIDLTVKFANLVDEQFAAASKKSMVTNNDYNWTGAHTVRVYKITTAEMNDYTRNTPSGMVSSRFGKIKDLDATTEELALRKDRSFTFVIDKLDENETGQTVAAAAALERQNREVVIPEVDAYTYNIMAQNAGFKPKPIQISTDNIYAYITMANATLDEAEVPETDRCIIVTPGVYSMMKSNRNIIMSTNIDEEKRRKGVIGMIDGCNVIKVPSVRLPKNFAFMIVHPSATVAPTKLEDYRIHKDPPGISGSLVEGRICYDAFVLDNKKKGIFYQEGTVDNA